MKKVGGDFLFNFIPRKRRQTWLEPNDDKILDDQGRVKEFIRLRMCREDCHAMYNDYGRKIDGLVAQTTSINYGKSVMLLYEEYSS